MSVLFLTMTLIQKKKKKKKKKTTTKKKNKKTGNIFFLNRYIFPQENEYKSILPRNAYGSPNFDKAACTKCSVCRTLFIFMTESRKTAFGGDL